MYLLFQTSTAGPSVQGYEPITNTAAWPRIICIAWSILDDSFNTIAQNYYLVKPQQSWTVDQTRHMQSPITYSKALLYGVDLWYALGQFLAVARDTRLTLVAHNAMREKKIIGAELFRLGLKVNLIYRDLINRRDICTEREAAIYANMQQLRSGERPSLPALYRHFFQSDIANIGEHPLELLRAHEECWQQLRLLKAS